MDIYFNKGTSREKVVTEARILKMNRQEIKQLKQSCQNAINDISMKRDNFKISNNLEKNSPEFLMRTHAYRAAIVKYIKAITWLSKVEANATSVRCEDKEHWLWCYYQESMKVLSEEMVSQLNEMADARAKYHCEIEQWEFRG